MASAGPARNVELKARDPDPRRTRARCREIGAVEQGTLRQRDTYFRVASGRLKLRQVEDEVGGVLVQYRRSDEPAARPSAYLLVPVPDPALLAEALTRALGILGVVEKERRLLLWQETARIHLDRVVGLGSFVEIEAVAAAGSDLGREREQALRLQALLEITPERVVAGSYIDLILAPQETSPPT
ncbi:MAG: class IV adenylate cyclase [Gaiellaceae bacterium]